METHFRKRKNTNERNVKNDNKIKIWTNYNFEKTSHIQAVVKM